MPYICRTANESSFEAIKKPKEVRVFWFKGGFVQSFISNAMEITTYLGVIGILYFLPSCLKQLRKLVRAVKSK
ncbi:hypothetical protein C4F50_00660 [Flavobacterium sp. KB82]|uniref:Uncharacterized protein n=1 Tax=Flavobacterium hungaricum TaxID=2082725 RepID=A0ABR9TDL5_9FLAO|nr:hypothetical protein [Flavobacterium hungaricum]